MTSRRLKLMLALVLVLGFGLAAAVGPAAGAPPFLDWDVIGKGSGSMTLSGGSSSGEARPSHIGNATYSLTLSSPGSMLSNGIGGLCVVITGSGSVTAADGSTINFLTVGLLCNDTSSSTPVTYNATYRITDGTGRFLAVAGGGNLAATFNVSHFIKIDGVIEF